MLPQRKFHGGLWANVRSYTPHTDINTNLRSKDKYRILEDGSQTQYRLCVIESLLPPRSDGPVFHFHEMHDEGFYVTVRTPRPPTQLLPPY
jgi:hypothetical protein